MRLGSVLLIVGFLLCVSIAWAALGFLMMGLGLICLLIAEERKKKLERLTTSPIGEPNNPKGPPLFPGVGGAARLVRPAPKPHEPFL